MLLALLPVYCQAQGWTQSGSNVILSTLTNYVGVGTTGPVATGNKFDVASGGVSFQSTAGGKVRFENPNGEEGMSIHTTGGQRADFRLDNSGLKIGMATTTSPVPNSNLMFVTPTGSFGIGILPSSSTYKLQVAGDTKVSGSLDIDNGNLVPNDLKVRGSTTEALADIQSYSSTTMTASPLKTGLFVNRTDNNDVNTSGAEIHGQVLGIRTSAQVFSAPKTTGIDAISLNPDADATGINSDATGNGLTYGIHTAGHSNGTAAYGIYAYASGTAANLYGVYGEIPNTTWSLPGHYGGYFRGDVYINGFTCGTNYVLTSDRKLKKDITTLNNGLTIISRLKPSTYAFRTDEYSFMNLPKEKQYGFIAQELEEVLPEAIKNMTIRDDKGEKFEYKAVNYIELIPVLTKAIQEQQVQIEAQQKEIESLKAAMVGNTTDVKEAGSVNSGSLSQNVPNPFNQSTVINYKLSSSAQNAAIGIYDLNGKEIKMIALGAETTGSITVAAGDLQPGMYVYSLIINGAISDAKKMVVASH